MLGKTLPMLNAKRLLDLLVLFLFLEIAQVFLPRFLLVDILAFSVLVYGFSLLYGYLGYLSFGHVAYFGVGSYAFVFAARHLGLDAFLSLAIALLAGALIGAMIGPILVRYGGAYFALLNLAISVVFYYAFLIFLKDYTGGFEGIRVPIRSSFIDLSDRFVLYQVVVIIFVISVMIYKMLVSSTYGYVLRAIKENEVRVSFLGYKPFLVKYIAFIISCIFSSLGGAMLVLSHGYVSATTFIPLANGEVVVMSMMGGPSALYGPLIGAFLFLLMKYVIAAYIIRWELFIGALVLALALLARGKGIADIVEGRVRAFMKIGVS